MGSTYILMIITFAIAFYRIGENEYKRGFILAGISLFLSVAGFFTPWGVLATILAQMGILVAMTVINYLRKPRAK